MYVFKNKKQESSMYDLNALTCAFVSIKNAMLQAKSPCPWNGKILDLLEMLGIFWLHQFDQ